MRTFQNGFSSTSGAEPAHSPGDQNSVEASTRGDGLEIFQVPAELDGPSGVYLDLPKTIKR